MQGWLDALMANIKAGDVKTFTTTALGSVDLAARGAGVGYMEAPRGALAIGS